MERSKKSYQQIQENKSAPRRRSRSPYKRSRSRSTRRRRSRSSRRSRSPRRKSRRRSRSRERRHKHSKKKHRRSRRSHSSEGSHRSSSIVKSDGKNKRSKKQPPLSEVLPPIGAASGIAQMMKMNPSASLQEIMASLKKGDGSINDVSSTSDIKAQRELYIGNLPSSVLGPQLQEFLVTIFEQVGLIMERGNPILSTWVSTDGHFAFCEMRSAEECNLALMLNGLSLLGQQLRFGRPKTYTAGSVPQPKVSPKTATALANLGCSFNEQWFSSTGSDDQLEATRGLTQPLVMPHEATKDSLLMTNIPSVLSEEQVREVVEPFGSLAFFKLLLGNNKVSLGAAVFEYISKDAIPIVIEGLSGVDLGAGHALNIVAAPIENSAAVSHSTLSSTLCLENMVTEAELNDDQEYSDLKEDVEEECKKYGEVTLIRIPRLGGHDNLAQIGKVFITFDSTKSSQLAFEALNGRKFGDNTVVASYFKNM